VEQPWAQDSVGEPPTEASDGRAPRNAANDWGNTCMKISAVAESPYFSECVAVSVAELPIQIDREQIARFCQERGIRKLSLFGSVLHQHFDPQRSDVDVLAEFEPEVLKNVGFRYFGYGEELAAIIGRKVDFCSRLHPLILSRVKDELFPVYESV
jgi:uncharacterized protein